MVVEVQVRADALIAANQDALVVPRETVHGLEAVEVEEREAEGLADPNQPRHIGEKRLADGKPGQLIPRIHGRSMGDAGGLTNRP